MAGMVKVTAKWQGFNGAPGYSNFFFRDFTESGEPVQADADGAVSRVNAFFGAIADRLPPNVNVTVQPEIQVIESTNGELKTAFTVATPTAIPGTAVETRFSGPAGVVITWRTATVVRGRRVRGRTFIVPVASSCYQNDGTIEPTSHADFATAAAALATGTGAPDLGVWSRPSVKGASDGVWAPVTNATVPDMAAVLRSRRG